MSNQEEFTIYNLAVLVLKYNSGKFGTPQVYDLADLSVNTIELPAGVVEQCMAMAEEHDRAVRLDYTATCYSDHVRWELTKSKPLVIESLPDDRLNYIRDTGKKHVTRIEAEVLWDGNEATVGEVHAIRENHGLPDYLLWDNDANDLWASACTLRRCSITVKYTLETWLAADYLFSPLGLINEVEVEEHSVETGEVSYLNLAKETNWLEDNMISSASILNTIIPYLPTEVVDAYLYLQEDYDTDILKLIQGIRLVGRSGTVEEELRHICNTVFEATDNPNMLIPLTDHLAKLTMACALSKPEQHVICNNINNTYAYFLTEIRPTGYVASDNEVLPDSVRELLGIVKENPDGSFQINGLEGNYIIQVEQF